MYIGVGWRDCSDWVDSDPVYVAIGLERTGRLQTSHSDDRVYLGLYVGTLQTRKNNSVNLQSLLKVTRP